jgi:hypothetical protein
MKCVASELAGLEDKKQGIDVHILGILTKWFGVGSENS